jgi:predicted RNA binding protein YcfA (HicA-like mRNA interferase family)
MMMMAAPIKRREVVTALLKAGCSPRGTAKRGGHEIWKCPCGAHTTALPRHRDISPGTCASIIKHLQCLEEGWLR